MSYRVNRPSPSDSATKFPVGHVQVGNDGNTWEIVQTRNGVQRWKKQQIRSVNPTVEACITKKRDVVALAQPCTKHPNKTKKTRKPKCQSVHPNARRANRPSPSTSATLFKVGHRQLGNDGNTWKIVQNKNGVQRWQKVKPRSKTIKTKKCATKKTTKKRTITTKK